MVGPIQALRTQLRITLTQLHAVLVTQPNQLMAQVNLIVKAAAEQFALVRILEWVRLHFLPSNLQDYDAQLH